MNDNSPIILMSHPFFSDQRIYSVEFMLFARMKDTTNKYIPVFRACVREDRVVCNVTSEFSPSHIMDDPHGPDVPRWRDTANTRKIYDEGYRGWYAVTRAELLEVIHNLVLHPPK